RALMTMMASTAALKIAPASADSRPFPLLDSAPPGAVLFSIGFSISIADTLNQCMHCMGRLPQVVTDLGGLSRQRRIMVRSFGNARDLPGNILGNMRLFF